MLVDLLTEPAYCDTTSVLLRQQMHGKLTKEKRMLRVTQHLLQHNTTQMLDQHRTAHCVTRNDRMEEFICIFRIGQAMHQQIPYEIYLHKLPTYAPVRSTYCPYAIPTNASSFTVDNCKQVCKHSHIVIGTHTANVGIFFSKASSPMSKNDAIIVEMTRENTSIW